MASMVATSAGLAAGAVAVGDAAGVGDGVCADVVIARQIQIMDKDIDIQAVLISCLINFISGSGWFELKSNQLEHGPGCDGKKLSATLCCLQTSRLGPIWCW